MSPVLDAQDPGTWEQWGRLVVHSINQIGDAVEALRTQLDRVEKAVASAESEIAVLKTSQRIYVSIAVAVSSALTSVVTGIVLTTLG